MTIDENFNQFYEHKRYIKANMLTALSRTHKKGHNLFHNLSSAHVICPDDNNNNDITLQRSVANRVWNVGPSEQKQ